jgi:hypothetical protein
LKDDIMTSRQLTAIALFAATFGMPAAAWAQQPCDVRDMSSPPAVEWIQEYGWRYPSPAAAQAGYLLLVDGQSPWPDWFHPTLSVLLPGTQFQMALAATQTDDQPGAFGTFDWIDSVEEVREDLAVLQAWKPDVQRVTTYRITQPLLVYVGPIGPQVDPLTCQLLQGRFSQLQMLVPGSDRMRYLEVVTSRPIQ